MRSRVLIALVLALMGSSLLATSAAAGSPHGVRKQAHKVIRDCARDDDLDRRYSLRALRLALKLLPDDIRHYTGCEKAIRRAIRKAVHRKLLPDVKKIYRECARDDDLDRRYSLPALRRALKRLPDDLWDYTGCERAIRRAIKKARKHHHGHHGPGHHKPHRRTAAIRAA